MARTTSSIATTAPAMVSSTTIVRHIAKSKQWMAGRKCSPSWKRTSSSRQQGRSPIMCTMIAHQAKIQVRGKNGQDWFEVREANVSYDHPYDMPLEHGLNIDFVNEAQVPAAPVAVELSVEAARELVKTIEAVLAQADERGVLVDKHQAASR